MSTCQYEIEMWGPHPGCREFMTEPEAVVTCGRPASVRHTEADPTGTLTELLCDEHASDALSSLLHFPADVTYRQEPTGLDIVVLVEWCPQATPHPAWIVQCDQCGHVGPLVDQLQDAYRSAAEHQQWHDECAARRQVVDSEAV